MPCHNLTGCIFPCTSLAAPYDRPVLNCAERYNSLWCIFCLSFREISNIQINYALLCPLADIPSGLKWVGQKYLHIGVSKQPCGPLSPHGKHPYRQADTNKTKRTINPHLVVKSFPTEQLHEVIHGIAIHIEIKAEGKANLLFGRIMDVLPQLLNRHTWEV